MLEISQWSLASKENTNVCTKKYNKYNILSVSFQQRQVCLLGGMFVVHEDNKQLIMTHVMTL